MVFRGCFRDHSELDVLDWLHFQQGALIAHVALEDHCKIILISDWDLIPGIAIGTYLRANDLEQMSHENGFSFVSVVLH